MKSTRSYLLCLLLACICLSLSACTENNKQEAAVIKDPVWTNLMELSNFVKPEVSWGHKELNSFLLRIPNIQRRFLFYALDKKEDLSNVNDSTAQSDAIAIQKELLWQSSSWITYKFKDTATIPYHEIVSWVAEKMGIDRTVTTCESTFILERMIFTKICADSWDKMSVEQRTTAIDGVFEDSSQNPAYALLPGTAFYTLLAAKNAAGFSYFTMQSSIISASARSLGIALPFAAFTAASSRAATITAIATSPIGLVVAAIATALAVACMMGKASVAKTATLIMQLHAIKVAALEAAALPVPDCPEYFIKSLK